jgi:hypothetical protein
MTVTELITKKTELEKSIRKLVCDYLNETDNLSTSIAIDIITQEYQSGDVSITGVNVKVKTII